MKQIPVTMFDPELVDIIERAKAANEEGASYVIADMKRRLKKLTMKAEAAGDYEHETVKPIDGPALAFSGRLIGQWSSHHGNASDWYEGEVWQTPRGAYVAILTALEDQDGEAPNDYCKAAVFPPCSDEQARRFEVIAFFNWRNHARGMARKMGWDLTRLVE